MTTTILLLGLPRLVQDLLHDAFSAQPSVQLIDAPYDEYPSENTLGDTPPKAVIVWRGAPAWPEGGADIWRRYPSAILVVETDGREITMHDRGPRPRRLSGESPAELAERIRRALARANRSSSANESTAQNPPTDP